MLGKIVSVSTEGGFGFITPDEEGGEIYFHRNALRGADFGELAPDVMVEFTLGQEAGARPSEGLHAVDVRLADDAVSAVERVALSAEWIGPS